MEQHFGHKAQGKSLVSKLRTSNGTYLSSLFPSPLPLAIPFRWPVCKADKTGV